MLNEEGGVDPEQFRMEAMFDRMDAIGKAMLGLTIQCSQCHNHKYDPITQEDYYRIFAFLNNDHEAHWPSLKDSNGNIDQTFFMNAPLAAGSTSGMAMGSRARSTATSFSSHSRATARPS